MTRADQIKVVIGISSFFTLIFLYVVEFDYLVNTIHVTKLVFNSFLLGCIAAAFIVWSFAKGMKLFEVFMLSVGLIVLSAIVMPLFGSLTNRMLGDRDAIKKTYPLLKIEARSEQPFGILDSTSIQMDGHQIVIQLPDGEESLYLKNHVSFEASDDSIILSVKRGFWGFTYVDLK